MKKKATLCVACKSPIPHQATKCLKCGSEQGWQRHLNIGNTSLSLIIALISIFSLTADNIIKVIDHLSDKKASVVTGKILEANPRALTFFVSNSGPGVAVLPNDLGCSIWPPKVENDLLVERNNEKGNFFVTRNPKPSEVAGRYIYFYEIKNSEPIILKSNETKVFHFTIRSVLLNKQDIPQNKELIESYCSWFFKQQNGDDGVIFDIMTSVKLGAYALDDKVAQSVIAKFYNH